MKTEKKKDGKSALWENMEAIVIAILLALFIRTFVVQAFKIPSGSMIPTLEIGDHLLVNKFIYGIKIPCTNFTLIPITDPKRNDVIVFKYPKDPDMDFIKRVIAVAGDTVEIQDKKVFVNNQPIDDSYAQFVDSYIRPASEDSRDNYGPITVPEGKLFVMGDNRDDSHDSRFWGYVDVDAVRGKAWIIHWSWDIQYPLFSLDRLGSIRWSRMGDSIE